MSYTKGINQFEKAAVSSASPLQLVIMLYDGALRFLHQGKSAMERGDLYEQNRLIQKAQRIVMELMSSLDMQKGGEVAKNLFALYSYCYNELIAGNVEDDPNKIDHAVRVLVELRESWIQLEVQTRSQSTEVSSDISTAA